MNKFSKMVYFLSSWTEKHVKELALIFLKAIWLHGLAESIISDIDNQFTSKFLGSLIQLFQVKLNVTTAVYPETECQTAKVNHTLEQYLRSYYSYQQDDWVLLLPFAEHAYNTTLSESTKTSPFEIKYRLSPSTQ